jgi:hypothetical protein
MMGLPDPVDPFVVYHYHYPVAAAEVSLALDLDAVLELAPVLEPEPVAGLVAVVAAESID